MSIHDILALQLSKCLKEASIPKWMTKGKTALINKEPKKGTHLCNYRPISCLPMMWKILNTLFKEEIYYPLECWGTVVYRIAERMPQVDKMKKWPTVHRSAHPQGEQSKVKKCGLGIDWIQKAQWYGLVKLDDWMSKNVQNIRQSHKFDHKSYEKMENGISSRTNPSRGENPKRQLPGRLTFVATICNKNDVT